MDYDSSVQGTLNTSEFNLTELEHLLYIIQRLLKPSDVLPEQLPSVLITLFYVLYITVMTFAVLGNVIVVVIISKYRPRRSVTDVYIVSLAVDDILIATVNMPVQLYYVVSEEWMATGAPGEILCKLTNYIQGVTIVACLLTLVAIAVDRYIVMCQPNIAKVVHSKKYAFVGVALVWILSLCILSPQLVFMKLDKRLKLSENEISFAMVCAEFLPGGKVAAQIESAVIYALLYCLPVLLMTFAYGTIAHRLWIQKPVVPSAFVTRHHPRNTYHKKRITKWMFIMVLVFAFLWFPFFTFTLYSDFHVGEVTSFKTKMAILRLIGYLNACVNPVIYSFLNRNFQKELVRRWKTYCLKPRTHHVTSNRTETEL